MKASQYIKELQKLMDEYGDLEVCDQAFDDDTKEYLSYPAKPNFWHRVKINSKGKVFIMNCFGGVPE